MHDYKILLSFVKFKFLKHLTPVSLCSFWLQPELNKQICVSRAVFILTDGVVVCRAKSFSSDGRGAAILWFGPMLGKTRCQRWCEIPVGSHPPTWRPLTAAARPASQESACSTVLQLLQSELREMLQRPDQTTGHQTTNLTVLEPRN